MVSNNMINRMDREFRSNQAVTFQCRSSIVMIKENNETTHGRLLMESS